LKKTLEPLVAVEQPNSKSQTTQELEEKTPGKSDRQWSQKTTKQPKSLLASAMPY
jgi:hypothetical protein